MPNRGAGILLPGLDGGNPLGFMAALGILRVLSLDGGGSKWRLNWVIQSSTWTPEISCDYEVLNRDEFVKRLDSALSTESTPEFDFDKDLKIDPRRFREILTLSMEQASSTNRRLVDFLSSYGSDCVPTDDGNHIRDTAFRTMSGAGHQHFLGTMKELAVKTEARHLTKALFAQWDYSDERNGMRWDPNEDRRYALRWKKPSTDVTRTMWGANRLAIESLPLFSTSPSRRHLETTGFSRQERANSFTWPIWDAALEMDSVRSVLSLGGLTAFRPDRTRLASMGIVEVFRCTRITVDKYRNFTEAEPA